MAQSAAAIGRSTKPSQQHKAELTCRPARSAWVAAVNPPIRVCEVKTGSLQGVWQHGRQSNSSDGICDYPFSGNLFRLSVNSPNASSHSPEMLSDGGRRTSRWDLWEPSLIWTMSQLCLECQGGWVHCFYQTYILCPLQHLKKEIFLRLLISQSSLHPEAVHNRNTEWCLMVFLNRFPRIIEHFSYATANREK